MLANLTGRHLLTLFIWTRLSGALSPTGIRARWPRSVHFPVLASIFRMHRRPQC